MRSVTIRTENLTTDSSSALNESSDGARSYEGPHADGESIDTISNGRSLEIQCDWVAKAGEFGHRVKSTAKPGQEQNLHLHDCMQGLPRGI